MIGKGLFRVTFVERGSILCGLIVRYKPESHIETNTNRVLLEKNLTII